MSDLISRNEVINIIHKKIQDTSDFLQHDALIDVEFEVDELPTVEAVPKSYAEQICWERDIAIEQLNEIGCQFGQKMDEVKKKLETTSLVKCKDCKYFCDGYPNLLNADGLCENVDCLVDSDDFCSFGERKENEINRCR